ncbi:hypothetical protein BASA81_011226 [Batrachochytrium salamandrivorans]|nr:hypothetical protein BASA81_011226 [Batrachochytrium salamandrivorans]
MQAVFPTLSLATFERQCREPASVPVRCVIIRWISRQVVQLLVDADYVSAFTRIITSLDATIVKSFKAWVPRSEAADKDKLAAISSFAAKTVTTIQRSPDVKARKLLQISARIYWWQDPRGSHC